MDRLAFDAACEHSLLHEEITQQTRSERVAAQFRADRDADDDDPSYEEVDVRARRAPFSPAFQSRAFFVPLSSMPMTRRNINNQERERDRGAPGYMEPQVDEPDLGALMPTIEPTMSAIRAEALSKLGEPNGCEHCFACRYARNQHVAPIALQGIEKMRAIIRSSAAGANKVAMALELYDFFEQEVRAPAHRWKQKDEHIIPEWLAADIYEHFFTTQHGRVDAISSTERRLLYLEQAQEAIFDEEMWSMRTTPDGRRVRVVNDIGLSKMLKLNDAINKMYTIDPQKLKMASQDAPNIAMQTSVAGRGTRLMGAGSSFRL